MQANPIPLDKWDAKAARIHGVTTDRETGAPVRLVAIDVSFGAIFRLVLAVVLAQAIIGGIVLAILVALGTL